MDYDVELMRDLLMVLEDRQLSPRETVIVDVAQTADGLACTSDAVDEGLNALLSLGYIDGPGADSPGFWFFRKLTRKGTQFLQAIRHPKDWERVKGYFAAQRTASRA